MSLKGASAKLNGITKKLLTEWAETKGAWRDEKCQQFERKYMEELLAAVNACGLNMGKLDQLLAKIKRDCE